ncbi:hypothetical protein ACFYZ9_33490 [Streptomyces sp. NPDC001691]|uniref:hypothetical protein n=1 Tax=Streptomyces sp. NPDC001691 TaxID=3364600 RepID=UPI003684E979
MAPPTKNKTVLRDITQGERDLRDWHRNMRIGAALAGYGMMLASLYQLHWAGTLIGFPWIPAAAMAGSLELLLAFNAGAVTSIRKRNPDGTEGGYYWSLWGIFGFLLCISIAANVGHCLVALSEWFGSGAAPQVMVDHQMWVYGVGSAVSAMVPLGGSFGLHVSGFVRKHGAGSDWSDSSGSAAVVTPGTNVAPAPTPAAGAKVTVRSARRLFNKSGRRHAAPLWAGQASAPAPQTELQSVPPAAASPAASIQPPRVNARVPEQPKPAAPSPAPATVPPRAEAEPVSEFPDDLSAEDKEKALYAIYRQARDLNQTERFRQGGDLNGSQLGLRLGRSAASGRNNVRPKFEALYDAELAKLGQEDASVPERQLTSVG